MSPSHNKVISSSVVWGCCSAFHTATYRIIIFHSQSTFSQHALTKALPSSPWDCNHRQNSKWARINRLLLLLCRPHLLEMMTYMRHWGKKLFSWIIFLVALSCESPYYSVLCSVWKLCSCGGQWPSSSADPIPFFSPSDQENNFRFLFLQCQDVCVCGPTSFRTCTSVCVCAPIDLQPLLLMQGNPD